MCFFFTDQGLWILFSNTYTDTLLGKGSYCGQFEEGEKNLLHCSYVHLITVLRLTVNPSLNEKYWGGCRGCRLRLTSLHLSTCSPRAYPCFSTLFTECTYTQTHTVSCWDLLAGWHGFLSSNWFCHSVLHLQNKTIDWESWGFSVPGEKNYSYETNLPLNKAAFTT